jgi:FMN phosphatase YigB (HAD superfamily)
MDASVLRAVIFDLDGTLYEAPWYMKPLVAARLVADVSILRHVGAAREAVRGREFGDGASLRAAFHAELGRRAGVDAEQARRWYEERFIGAFLDVLERHAEARPALVPLLSTLRGRGIGTAVLSDYGRVAERIERLRIPVTLFDDIASAEDSGALKPSASPFIMSARALGLEPGRVLVVGDRDDMDGRGARAAGMEFLGLGRGPRGWSGARIVLESLGV